MRMIQEDALAFGARASRNLTSYFTFANGFYLRTAAAYSGHTGLLKTGIYTLNGS